MHQLENAMLIGPYYDSDRYHAPEVDADEAYERVRQEQIDAEADARRRQEVGSHDSSAA